MLAIHKSLAIYLIKYTDDAYNTKQCRQVIADRQAHAVIPPKKFAKTK